jgi:hypothetical protein
LGRPSSKKKTTPRTFTATIRAASPIDANPSTSSRASYSITSGPKDVANTSTANTPSREFSFNRGRLRPRSAWPPRGPLGPLVILGIGINRIALSMPLRLNGFMATSLGRARLPFRGAYSPPCTFLISLMTEGAIASLPAKGSPYTSSRGPHPNGFLSRDFQRGISKLPKLELSQLCRAITLCSNLRLG